jgi:hypothetical protein
MCAIMDVHNQSGSVKTLWRVCICHQLEHMSMLMDFESTIYHGMMFCHAPYLQSNDSMWGAVACGVPVRVGTGVSLEFGAIIPNA